MNAPENSPSSDGQPWHRSPPVEDPVAVDAADAADAATALHPGNASEATQFGALDIVEAFTALRHELKLQVRGGRDLQQLLVDGLQRIEQRFEQRLAASQLAASQPPSATAADAGRDLAEALAEMDDSLHRVHQALARPTVVEQIDAPKAEPILSTFDEQVLQAPWWLRTFAAGWVQSLRQSLSQSVAVAIDEEHHRRELQSQDEQLKGAQQGIELLHARAQRLMQQCALERVDVVGQPFDAEWMHAVDVVVAPQTPSAHVAEQLRPAYRWRGKLLRYADVRLAR